MAAAEVYEPPLVGMQVYSSPALGADGTIYVGSDDNHLHAVVTAGGSRKWAYPADGSVALETGPGGSDCRPL